MPSKTSEQWAELVQKTRDGLPIQLGHQWWYLLIAAALSTSPSPDLLAEFYEYLIVNEPHFEDQQSEPAQRLSLQLRDILIKQVTLIGAPQVLMAFTPLAAAEGNPQRKAKESQLSPKWHNIDRDAIHARGTSTIHSIYGPSLLHDKIFPLWGHHTADIQFMELFTVYGLYLSDHTVLTPIETELVVFVTISCLGLGGTGPALWHLRGLGRLLGARGNDETTPQIRTAKDALRAVKVATMAVVEFVGEEFVRRAKLDTWPNVGDVMRVLSGWGENAPEEQAQQAQSTHNGDTA